MKVLNCMNLLNEMQLLNQMIICIYDTVTDLRDLNACFFTHTAWLHLFDNINYKYLILFSPAYKIRKNKYDY